MALDIDPLDTIEELQEDAEEHREHARLNGFVAVTVAILATFLGICNVKDDNVVQAMLVLALLVPPAIQEIQRRRAKGEVVA